MDRSSIDTLKEMVENLLMVYKSQLQVMESSKDNPSILDSSLIEASLETFKKHHAFLPKLVSQYSALKTERQSPRHATDLKSLKNNLDQLAVMGEQIIFLMENLQEHTQDQTWTVPDLAIMEKVFEHLNEKTGFSMDPKKLIEGVVSLKKNYKSPQKTSLEKENHRKQEAQNQAASLKIYRLVQELIIEGVHPIQIQGALFTQYVHMISLLVSSDPETYFHQQIANGGNLMLSLVHKLNFIEGNLEDDGPSDHMRKVAEKVTILRAVVQERLRRPLTKNDQQKHKDRLATAFFDLLENIGDASATFLASTFLYHWVRLSTLDSDVSEEYFQKLERNWDTVFDIIYNDELLKTS